MACKVSPKEPSLTAADSTSLLCAYKAAAEAVTLPVTVSERVVRVLTATLACTSSLLAFSEARRR